MTAGICCLSCDFCVRGARDDYYYCVHPNVLKYGGRPSRLLTDPKTVIECDDWYRELGDDAA